MNQPTVTAVMLTADRPEMARRAVECFRAQTYPAKRLLVYDTGAKPLHDLDIGDSEWPEWYAQRGPERASIGELRNLAATFPLANSADILTHWDDDDWSHPNRIAEQVALLQLSGADAVGYREMLFWREDHTIPVGRDMRGEALFDGDSVMSFNLTDLSGIRLPATLRRGRSTLAIHDPRLTGISLYVVTDDGTFTGCIPHEPKEQIKEVGLKLEQEEKVYIETDRSSLGEGL